MTSLIGVVLVVHVSALVVLDLVHELEGQVVILDLVPGLEVVDSVVLDLHFVLPLSLFVLEGQVS